MINYLTGTFRKGGVATPGCYVFAAVADLVNGMHAVEITVYSDSIKETVLTTRSDLCLHPYGEDESEDSKQIRALRMYQSLAPEMKLVSKKAPEEIPQADENNGGDPPKEDPVSPTETV